MRAAQPLLAAALALAACTSSHDPALTGAPAYGPDAEARYDAALGAWTREDKVYDGFKTALLLRGTLLSPAFMEALGLEVSRLKLLPPPEREAEVASTLLQVADRVQVLFGASSPVHPNMALTKANSLWRIRLLDDEGRWANPLKVEAFHKSSRLEPSILFPYLTRWDDAYVADFPLTPEGADRPFLGSDNRVVIFQLAGEPAAGELRWEVDASAVATDRPMPTPVPPPTPTPGALPAAPGDPPEPL